MTIGLLATGDELTHGDTLNTLTQVIAKALSSDGFPMGTHVVCGDKERELVEALSFLGNKHQVIIITGGLGPTSDDRTRFALATHLNKPLIEYSEASTHVEARLTRAKLVMNKGNHQQTLFPEGARLFPNANGTAMGCAYRQNEKLFILLPGPPKECMPMFQIYALPLIRQLIGASQKKILTWRLFAVAESQIAEVLEHALIHINCQIGYCLETPYLLFKVRCEKNCMADVRAAVEPLVSPYIIAPPEKTASERLCALLDARKIQMTIIDDVTGGVLQRLLQKPENYNKLLFRDENYNQATFYFHASGLQAYWQGVSGEGSSDVALSYRLGDEAGEVRYTLPRIGAWSVHMAAEWLSFSIAQLINQVHNSVT